MTRLLLFSLLAALVTGCGEPEPSGGFADCVVENYKLRLKVEMMGRHLIALGEDPEALTATATVEYKNITNNANVRHTKFAVGEVVGISGSPYYGTDSPWSVRAVVLGVQFNIYELRLSYTAKAVYIPGSRLMPWNPLRERP